MTDIDAFLQEAVAVAALCARALPIDHAQGRAPFIRRRHQRPYRHARG
jgi:hypothetical protein